MKRFLSRLGWGMYRSTKSLTSLYKGMGATTKKTRGRKNKQVREIPGGRKWKTGISSG